MTLLEPRIIYEDADMLVVDKPAGMIVNKAETTTHQTTIQEWVEERLHISLDNTVEKLLPDGNYNPLYEFQSRGGIVHRLDKETSGLLLIAKHVESFAKLQQQFKERTIKKTYIALAHGLIVPGEGEIRVPMGRLSFNRKRFGVVAGGRESVTFYKVLQVFTTKSKHPEEVSLVELYPQTGRTHQIRVHLKYIHHPIFSDELYAGRKTAREDRIHLPRLFLHAAKITLLHPITKRSLTFSSDLPTDLQQFLSFYCS